MGKGCGQNKLSGNIYHLSITSKLSKTISMQRTFSTLLIILILLSIHSCSTDNKYERNDQLAFDANKVNHLYTFAYHCIDLEYPNKLGQVLSSDDDLAPPSILHPAFYGCFDWHSAVHGHWTLVTILSNFPDFEYSDSILAKLKSNLTQENIEREVAFFDDELNKNFQRTYGWAWLLKLDEALRDWQHPEAIQLQRNLQPLSDMIADKFSAFLDQLIYPIRVGEHPNTAFGMSLAYDYAKKYNPPLAQKIENKAKEYYLNDENCPLTWEPGGFDFISPCLQEASLMLKVLPEKDFGLWLKKFLPGLAKNPAKFLQPAIVTDASDGKLAHLDGLNFNRAWCLFEMGNVLENQAMIDLGIEHFNFSYEKMDKDEYMGSHWLASFATMAIVKYNR